MKVNSAVEIVDITENIDYARYLYRCLAPMPFVKYRKRREYLESAIPKGFRKKILIFNGDVVGTIEYTFAEGSGFPIKGDNVIVMNCIWVLRKAKKHNFGKRLLVDMMKKREEGCWLCHNSLGEPLESLDEEGTDGEVWLQIRQVS